MLWRGYAGSLCWRLGVRVPLSRGRRAVLSGAAQAVGEIQPEGSSGEDSTAAVQLVSSEHETAVYLFGLRILLERRPQGDATGHAPHGSQEVARGVQADQGMDQVEPALAGW